MNTEAKGSLDVRAATFAALGDPMRLAIVDLLADSDLSPSALREELGVTSNLLSHHLAVLETRGIVRRSRSEGDRRRSYVRLLPGALDALLPRRRVAAMRVLFVCTGNSARSRLASALWQRESEVPSASAGTAPAPHVAPGAVAVAKRHDLTLDLADPRALGEVLQGDDVIVTVCDAAHESVSGAAYHWSIPDPVRVGTDAAFELVFEDIARRVGSLVPAVAPRA